MKRFLISVLGVGGYWVSMTDAWVASSYSSSSSPTCCLTTATTTALFAAKQSNEPDNIRSGGGKGFGGKPRTAPAKTYGTAAEATTMFSNEVINIEAAMQDFFTTREEWLPLFRGLSASTCPARSFWQSTASSSSASLLSSSMQSTQSELEFHEQSWPWRRLQAIPQHAADKAVLATFLDSVHQSLLDIPVTESARGQQDENDLHFLEEGRRMLAINRFHVIRSSSSGSNTADDVADVNVDDVVMDTDDNRVERYERLFATCWSELMELRTRDEAHTGSLILLPGSHLSDVRRFCDINIHRPLEWLGLRPYFEVASLERGAPAIRLLYKLGDIPDIPDDDERPYRD